MLQQAFDTYAPTYDDHFTNSLIGKEQRRQVRRIVNKYFKLRRKKILELNCGTGEDACWMAQQNARVWATDISENMIEIAQQKNTAPSVRFKVLRTQDISILQPRSFDIIFSNFGGLNCLSPDELKNLKEHCLQLQQPGSKLVFVIMGSSCIWERFFFNRRKEPVKAQRRQNKKGVTTNILGEHFLTYYFSPAEMKQVFGNEYKCILLKPVGLFVPPTYLEPYFKNRKRLFYCLSFLDRLIARFPLFANKADHYLIAFERKTDS